MKAWLYYAKPRDVFPNASNVKETEEVYGENTDILYAMTAVKKDAKVFKSMRNMNIFHETIIDVTEDEWGILLKDNRECLLEYHKLRTAYYPPDKSSPMDLRYVQVLLTFMEHADIDDNTDLSVLVFNNFLNFMSPIGILRTTLLKKLFKLHYWDTILLTADNDMSIVTDLCPVTNIDDHMLELSHDTTHTLHTDQLEYFIHNYAHTLVMS